LQENIHPIFDQLVSRSERQAYLKQNSQIFWLTGLSGSGKSTIAKVTERKLLENGFFAQVLDGDNIRTGICNNLRFSMEDRTENIRRIAEVAKLYLHSGVITICSFISPTHEIRKMAKEIIGHEDFSEVYIHASLETCESRDVKGLYKKARAGKLQGFTGINSPYEEPLVPDLVLDTEKRTLEESVEGLLQFIISRVRLEI